jgi:hypothetical protein
VLIVRQSTARTVTVGPVLDADGVAVTVGVVADFKISKNGGAPAALDGSATLTHRHTGHYSLALTANDLDTVGQAEVVIDDTVNACPMKEITVLEEAVYDALYAASATGMLPANVTQWGGSATPVTNFTTVFSTDFAANYDATNDVWKTNVTFYAGVAAVTAADRTILFETTIASVTSQTVWVLTDGPSVDAALVDHTIDVLDSVNAYEFSSGHWGGSYTGSTKTLTVNAAPGFTVAAGDKVVVHGKKIAAGMRGVHTGNTVGNRTGNIVGSVSTVLANGPGSITVTSFEVGALSANAVDAGFLTDTAVTNALANRLADHARRRTQANVEASSYGDAVSVGSEYGLIQQQQESNLVDNAGFLTVYKTDGTTELAQKAVTTDAAGEPVTGIS